MKNIPWLQRVLISVLAHINHTQKLKVGNTTLQVSVSKSTEHVVFTYELAMAALLALATGKTEFTVGNTTFDLTVTTA